MKRASTLFLAVAALLATVGCQQQGSLTGVLATGEPFVTSIAVDGEFVYWTRADGTVKKVSLDTGLISTIGQQSGSTGNLVLDEANVYWSVDSNLLKAPKAGGAVEIHPQVASIKALSLDEASVYWTAADNTVSKASKDGMIAQTLAMSTNPQPIMAGESLVTWGSSTLAGELFQVPAAGGAAVTLPLAGGGPVLALAQDTSHIYFGTAVNDDTANGTINMMDPDTSNPQVLASGQSTPVGIATDAVHVYWSNVGGQVMAVPIAGGAPQQIVQGPTVQGVMQCPVSMALDATNIYWANACDDAILTVPRL